MFVEVHVERGRIRALLPCATGSVIRTETSTFEFPGCSLYPGFVDNHAQSMGLGEFLSNTRLDSSMSEQQAVQLLPKVCANRGWLLTAKHDTDERLQVMHDLEGGLEVLRHLFVHVWHRVLENELEKFVHLILQAFV